MAKYKHFTARSVPLSELASAPKVRKLSPRQLAALEREADIKAALNEAAALPASEAFAITLRDGESLQNYRNAFKRIWESEPRELNIAGRNKNTILISKGKLPGKTWNLRK